MIVCRKCGFHNGDTDTFCGSCGSFLEFTGEKIVPPKVDVPTAEEFEAEEPKKKSLLQRITSLAYLDVGDRAPAAGAGGPGWARREWVVHRGCRGPPGMGGPARDLGGPPGMGGPPGPPARRVVARRVRRVLLVLRVVARRDLRVRLVLRVVARRVLRVRRVVGLRVRRVVGPPGPPGGGPPGPSGPVRPPGQSGGGPPGPSGWSAAGPRVRRVLPVRQGRPDRRRRRKRRSSPPSSCRSRRRRRRSQR